MHSLIEVATISGLLLLTGSCFFQYLLGAGSSENIDLDNRVARHNTTALITGLLLFVAGSIAQRQELIFTAGQVSLAIIVFIAADVGLRKKLIGSRLIAVVSAFGLLFLQTVTSHSALEPGLLPTISHFVHGTAAAVLGGSLLHLLLQTSPADGPGDAEIPSARLARRYAVLSLVVIVILGITGGLLAFVHIHNADAMNTSDYGSAFKFKMAAATLLLLAISGHCLRTTSANANDAVANNRQQARATLRRLLLAQTMIVLVIIFSTGILASRQTVGIAPFLNPQSWTLDIDRTKVSVTLQPVAGRAGKARFEITAEPPDAHFSDGTLAEFSVISSDGAVGQRGIEAIPIGPAAFLGDAILAVPGEWQFELTMDFPDRGARHATQSFTLPDPPLREDMFASLRTSTIGYSRANLLTFGIGLLLIIVAAWSVALALKKRAPAWLMPASLINAALGGYLILSVAFVKTYPSSFWPNPVPFTAAAIRAGEPLYQTHCAECHGVAGLGDGSWAIANRGRIPDLTAPHMDSHTDGEIYWWIRYGIPSLEMPPLGDNLDEREIWTVINFVRGLRHGTPPEH